MLPHVIVHERSGKPGQTFWVYRPPGGYLFGTMKTSFRKRAFRFLALFVVAFWMLALLAVGGPHKPGLPHYSRAALGFAAPLFSVAIGLLWRQSRKHH